MSASWDGRVALHEADAKPGHYYVTVSSQGKTVLALGPFTQRRLGKEAHAQALGLMRRVRRYVQAHDHSPHSAWYEFGTSRLEVCGNPPQGKLNDLLRAS